MKAVDICVLGMKLEKGIAHLMQLVTVSQLSRRALK